MKVKTSVIIPTINRKTLASRLLENLAKQTVEPDQIILVETGELNWNVSDLPQLLQRKIYPMLATGCSTAMARAIGQGIATGDLLFFFDDDIIMPSTYLESAISYLAENPQIVAISGSYVDPIIINRKPINLLVGRLFGIYANGHSNRILSSGWTDYVRGDYAHKVTNADWLCGCNFVVKAEAFSKVQFETQMLKWSFLDDVFFSISLRDVFGDCLRILPSLQVIHDPQNSRGKINKFTLRMRILHRFILWRDHISKKYSGSLFRFILGMVANLLLMIKQEKKIWVVPESIRTLIFIMQHPDMDWEDANRFMM